MTKQSIKVKKMDGRRDQLLGEVKLFKQMNPNEASQTRRLEVDRTLRETKYPDFPTAKNQTRTPEMEGKKNVGSSPEKVNGKKEWSSKRRGGGRQRGPPEFKVVFRCKDCPLLKDPTQTSSGCRSLFIRPRLVCVYVCVCGLVVSSWVGDRRNSHQIQIQMCV